MTITATLLERIRRIPAPWLIGTTLLLCLPAFLVHLGLFAFTGDEAIRALVALEMKLSGNYIATTMHGADYINKPPLFNWFILLVSNLWGGFGEWPSRITTLLFLTLFGYLHFRWLRPLFGRDQAFLGAMMLVTSGRLLFYDAMLGLIDTAFSCTMYALFMSLYYLGRQGKWRAFFLVSYALMTAGFMLKGFPSIVFQGLSLLTALLYFGKIRLLFSWQHLAGGILSLVILGLYLLVLGQYRDLETFVSNLMNESTKRTVIAFGWGKFWTHLIKFPLESIYHFLPWSLFIVFWLDRQFLQKVRAQPFVWFNLLILAVNLPVYWSSIQVQARYLLMFIPLFNTVGLWLLTQNQEENSLRYRIFYHLLGILLLIGCLGGSALPFIPAVHGLPGIYWIAGGLFITMSIAGWLYFRERARYLWWFIMGLLIIRTAFNLVVLPIRNDESIVTRARADVRSLADKYRDRTWWVYGDAYIREPASFYLTQHLRYIIHRTTDTRHPNAIYIVNPDVYPQFPGICVDTLQTDYPEIRHLLYITEE